MLAVGVTTCLRGDDNPYFQRTLRSIREAGFFIDVVMGDGNCEPLTSFAASFGVTAVCGRCGPLLGPKPTFKKCLYQLIQFNRPHILAFEDDIRVAKGCADWLTDNMPDGVWSLYCSTPQDQHDGWRQLDLTPQEGNPKPWGRGLGACAIGMDRDTAMLYLDNDPDFYKGNAQGHSLARFCQRYGVPFSIFAPSLIAHIGEISCHEAFPMTEERREARFCNDVKVLA